MKQLSLLLSLVFLLSCSNNNSDTAAGDGGDTIFLKTDTINTPFEVPVKIVSQLIWTAAYDSAKKQVVLKQQRQVSSDTLNAAQVIGDINLAWDEVKLEFKKIGHDTLYVTIPESNTLTNGMGTTGAYSYISSTTYSLTELKNIRYVNYNFMEGDHLAPGIMKRADFKQ